MADIEGWIVAKTEGRKVADITSERAGKLPTQLLRGLESGRHFFLLLNAVGWKVADIDFICSSEGWNFADIVFWIKLPRKTMSATFQPSELHEK